MLEIVTNTWRALAEIFIIALALYQTYRAFRATRGAQILIGVAIIFAILVVVSQVADFKVIEFLVTRAAPLMAMALVVVFQPELRDALARLGSRGILRYTNNQRRAFIERVADAVVSLSKKRVGGLIAIERGISLKRYLETGVELDAQFSVELAHAVFLPPGPLHDGGMILAEGRVAAAACVFPLSQREMVDRSLGLRHRAAIGLAEESDAVVVVISEETGAVSICADRNFERNLTEKQFRDRIARFFLDDRTIYEIETAQKLGS